MTSLFYHRTKVERERWKRIRVAVAAYAYEFLDCQVMSDAEFDKMCKEINPSIDTGHLVMDAWFRKEFNPSTGQWIHKHPQLDGIRRLYETYYHSLQR